MKKNDAGNTHNAGAAAAAIRVVGNPEGRWINPGVFSRPVLLKASAILALGSFVSGVFSLLYARKAVSVTQKDFLVGAFYLIMFSGVLRLSGKLNAKRAAMLVANVVVFQTWNTLFFNKSPLEVGVVLIGLWLPFYWMYVDPEMMIEMGLVKKRIPAYFLAGVVMAASLVSYSAWGMKNFGFTFKIDAWRLIENSAQVLPMYLSIFCMMYFAWNKLKSQGLSSVEMLLALTFMSACINVPAFALVGLASRTPFFVTSAGFMLITGIMALSMHLTFGRFRSALPEACLFTAMSALLLMTGLV